MERLAFAAAFATTSLLAACAAKPANTPRPAETRKHAAKAQPARVTTTATQTPCFPGPPLVASSIYSQLQRYSQNMQVNDKPLPSGTFGSCRIDKAIIYAANGSKVAELGCGLLVRTPGVVDFVGAQVGTRAQVVIDRHPQAAQRIVCVSGRGESRCWFRTKDDNEQPATRYTVPGTLPGDMLRGAPALAFFAKRNIVRFHTTMYCH